MVSAAFYFNLPPPPSPHLSVYRYNAIVCEAEGSVVRSFEINTWEFCTGMWIDADIEHFTGAFTPKENNLLKEGASYLDL